MIQIAIAKHWPAIGKVAQLFSDHRRAIAEDILIYALDTLQYHKG